MDELDELLNLNEELNNKISSLMLWQSYKGNFKALKYSFRKEYYTIEELFELQKNKFGELRNLLA